jgi:hypothetical protein
MLCFFENGRKKSAFLLEILLVTIYCDIGFSNAKRQFFRRKLAKIAEKSENRRKERL